MPAEHAQLSSDQKSSLKTLRVARDGKGNQKGNETRIAAQLLTTMVDAWRLENKSDDKEEDKDKDQEAGNSNRNHEALKRPKRG